VQAVIRAHQTPAQAAGNADTVAALLAAHCPGSPDNPDSCAGWTALGPHLLYATADLGADDPHQLRFHTDSFCWHRHARGEYAAVHTLAAHLHQQATRALGDDHPDTPRAAHTHAAILGALGRPAGARALAEDTLTRRRPTLGDDHPATLTSASNLARRLAALGDLQAARTLDEDTLTRRRRTLGDDHPDTRLSEDLLRFVRERPPARRRALEWLKQWRGQSDGP
jgi:Tetratricopeptide repeat